MFSARTESETERVGLVFFFFGFVFIRRSVPALLSFSSAASERKF